MPRPFLFLSPEGERHTPSFTLKPDLMTTRISFVSISRTLPVLLALSASTLFLLSGCGTQRHAPGIIFDTDMAPDYDDVGALALLHALADSGEARILATVSSNKCATCVPCIEVINTYFGRPDIPTGCVKGDAPELTTWHKGLRWTEELPRRYAHRTASSDESEDALKVYRRVLSKQPDHSVTIVTVGFLSNLRYLLESGPDQYSRLDGTALVRKKVKRLVCMAGKMPEGTEFNVVSDTHASQVVFGQWPTPVLLSGFDIGNAILTGKRLAASETEGSPVADVFAMCLPQDNPEGRMSWDQTAALVGVRGTDGLFKTERGVMVVLPDGKNVWVAHPKGPHEHLLFDMPQDRLADLIERLMMHRPEKQ